jgi:hypothetical protein
MLVRLKVDGRGGLALGASMLVIDKRIVREVYGLLDEFLAPEVGLHRLS